MPTDSSKRNEGQRSLETLLATLEDRLRSFGAPIVDHLQPGLSEDEVRADLTAEGLAAPEELVIWWGWHNGTDVPPGRGELGVMQMPENALFDFFHLMSLSESLRSRRWTRELYDGQGWPEGYPLGWVPLLFEGTLEWCADTQADEGVTPMYLFHHGGGTVYPPEPRTDSLAALIDVFVRVFDDGVVRPKPEDPRVPSLRGAALPDYVRRLNIWPDAVATQSEG